MESSIGEIRYGILGIFIMEMSPKGTDEQDCV